MTDITLTVTVALSDDYDTTESVRQMRDGLISAILAYTESFDGCKTAISTVPVESESAELYKALRKCHDVLYARFADSVSVDGRIAMGAVNAARTALANYEKA